MLQDPKISIEDVVSEKVGRRPSIVEFTRASENPIWDFGIDQDYKDKVIEEDGFIYKCIADCGSNPATFGGYQMFAGSNIIERIMKMQPFGHLGGEVIEIYYPENRMSPEWQSAFVYQFTQHPDFKDVKELRIMTRSPWFVSDCKSEFCRIIPKEGVASAEGWDDYKYFIPKIKKKGFKRLSYQREDFILSKPDRLYSVYLKGAELMVHYVGECDNYVYWINVDTEDATITKCKTPHLEFWYRLNALWIDKIPLEEFKNLKTSEDFDKLIVKYAD